MGFIMGFNHQICNDCWELLCQSRNQEGREPVRVRDDGIQQCCFCFNWNDSGIYVRGHPTLTPCHGKGPYHEQEEK